MASLGELKVGDRVCFQFGSEFKTGVIEYFLSPLAIHVIINPDDPKEEWYEGEIQYFFKEELFEDFEF